MKGEIVGIHDGHRQRLKNKFINHGLEGFDEHQVLELLLFYAVPREDTNPLAHRLLDTFGSISDVFDAPYEELLKVDGIGANTAVLIKMLPQIARRYMISKVSTENILTTANAVGDYILPRFYGEKDEVVYLISLDAKCKVLGCDLICRGTVSSANISIRKIVEKAISRNATAVVLAHNHISGLALPSIEDVTTTERIKEALVAVDIQLLDHVVVSDDDYISFAADGRINFEDRNA